MTTQEANIRDNQTITFTNHASIYFPDVRELTHCILTGHSDYTDTVFPEKKFDLTKLSAAYNDTIYKNFSGNNVQVSVKFTHQGLAFSTVERVPITDTTFENKENVYLVLDWKNDITILQSLCALLNELTMQCVRKIPDLCQDSKTFRNINNIDTNPIYDQLAFVYALHLKVGETSKILKCYPQLLMLTRRTTYVSMCHALKYATTFPETVSSYFENVSIITEKENFVRNEEGKFVPGNDKSFVINLINYAGQKFSQRLQLSANVKREILESDRFVKIDNDASVMG